MAPIVLKRQPVICYTRIVGWLTPIKNFNKGKAQEHKDRVPFVIKQEQYEQDIKS